MPIKGSKSIGLQFGVLGGASLSGETGSRILADLKSIALKISNENKIKIKVSLDTSSTKSIMQAQLKELVRGLNVEELGKLGIGTNSSNKKNSGTEQQNSSLKNQLSLYRQIETVSNKLSTNSIGGKLFTDKLLNPESVTKVNTAVSELKQTFNTLKDGNGNLLPVDQLNVTQLNDAVAKYKEVKTVIQDVKNQNDLLASSDKSATSYAKISDNMYRSISRVQDVLQKTDPAALQQLRNIADSMSKGNYTNVREGVQQFTQLEGILFKTGKTYETFGQKVAYAIKTKYGYAAIALMIQFTRRALSEIFNDVKDIDSAMVELKKVTEETDTVYNNFLVQSANNAKNLGASISDIVNATADFARLGYSIEDASQMAQAAIVYKNVGDGIKTVDEATESLISTMSAFHIEADDTMSIVDAFNEVGNNFKISSSGVGEALKRSAAAMAAGNNTLSETIGLATGMNSVIQDPEKVGTSLKTISMYLRAAKTEAEDAGESTDGMATSVSKLRDQLLSLTGGQVDIMLDKDTFKSTFQIMKELSQVWGSLTDVTQANITNLIGGKRNANSVTSLLTNFSDAEAAAQTAANSTGSALSENEKVLNSVQGKLNILDASVQNFSTKALNTDLVKGFIDIATALVDGAASMQQINALIPAVVAGIMSVKNVGIVNSTGGALGLQLPFGLSGSLKSNQVSSSIDQFNASLRTNELDMENFSRVCADGNASLEKYFNTLGTDGKASLKAYQIYTVQTTVKTIGLRVATMALNMAIGALIGVLFTVGYQLIDSLVTTPEEAAEALTDAKNAVLESKDSIEEYNKELQTTEDRIQELRVLKDNGTISLLEENELTRLINYNQELKTKSRLEQKALNDKKIEAAQSFNTVMGQLNDGKSYDQTEYIEMDGVIQKKTFLSDLYGYTPLGLIASILSPNDSLATGYSTFATGNMLLAKQKNNTIADDEKAILGDIYTQFSEASKDIEYGINDTTDAWLDKINDFNIKYLLATGDTEDITVAWTDILTSKRFEDAISKIKELDSAGKLTTASLSQLYLSGDTAFVSFIDKLEEYGLLVLDVNNDGTVSTEELADAMGILCNQFVDNEKAINATNNELETFDSILTTVKDRVNLVAQVQKELAETGYLTTDSVSKILALGSEYQQYLTATSDGYVLSAEGLNKLINSQGVEYEVALNEAQTAAEAIINQESSKLAGYDLTNKSLKERLILLKTLEMAEIGKQAKEAGENGAIKNGRAETASIIEAATLSRLVKGSTLITSIDEALANLDSSENNLSSYKAIQAMLNRESASSEKTVKDTSEKDAEEAAKEYETAKDSLEELVKLRIDMIKEVKEAQKKSLEDELSDFKDYCDERKQMLQDQYDEEDYIAELAIKKKKVSDLEWLIRIYGGDNSAKAVSKVQELTKDLVDAQKELDDYQTEHSRDVALSAIDKQYDEKESQINDSISQIDNELNNTYGIRLQAIDDIKNAGQDLYEQMILYNRQYGDGIDYDITQKWQEAQQALSTYANLLNEIGGGAVYVGTLNPNASYASGTSNSVGGIARTDENGYELKALSTNGGFTFLTPHSKVFRAASTDFLYNFSLNPAQQLSRLLPQVSGYSSVAGLQAPSISFGDFNVYANSDLDFENSLNKYRKAVAETVLTEFKKLNY